MAIWELEQHAREYEIVKELVRTHHQHLAEAKIVIYGTDKNSVSGRRVTIAKAAKASPKMKASTNADFTITLYMMPWGDLNESQKRACMDHELMHCGVQYEPVKEQVGVGRGGKPKWKVVKDEYGRKQYTDEIVRDEFGVPKWRLVPHDLEEFREIVRRHGMWDESIQEFKQAIDAAPETATIPIPTAVGE